MQSLEIDSSQTPDSHNLLFYEMYGASVVHDSLLPLINRYDPDAIVLENNRTTHIISEKIGIDILCEKVGIFKRKLSDDFDSYQDLLKEDLFGVRLGLGPNGVISENKDLCEKFMAEAQEIFQDIGSIDNIIDTNSVSRTYISSHLNFFPLYFTLSAWGVYEYILYDHDLLSLAALPASFAFFTFFDYILGNDYENKTTVSFYKIEDPKLEGLFRSTYDHQYDMPLKEFISMFFDEGMKKISYIKHFATDTSKGLYSIFAKREISDNDIIEKELKS